MTEPAPLVVDASALASLLLPDETPVALEPGDMAGGPIAPALALARWHRLTVYDALYLELALRRGAALATRDEALAAAARAEGVAIPDQSRA